MTDYPVNLQMIVRDTLRRYDFLIDVPADAAAQALALKEPDFNSLGLRDLSGLLWSSIDNDDSRDLDQIEYLSSEPDDARLFIGIRS